MDGRQGYSATLAEIFIHRKTSMAINTTCTVTYIAIRNALLDPRRLERRRERLRLVSATTSAGGGAKTGLEWVFEYSLLEEMKLRFLLFRRTVVEGRDSASSDSGSISGAPWGVGGSGGMFSGISKPRESVP